VKYGVDPKQIRLTPPLQSMKKREPSLP